MLGFHNEDARNLDRIVKPGSIDCTITSPPYWDSIDYGVKDQIGYGQGYGDFLDDVEIVLSKVHEATRDSGSLWLITDFVERGGKTYTLPFDISKRADSLGWNFVDLITWKKDRGEPLAGRSLLTNLCEYILFFAKSRDFKYRIDRIREPKRFEGWWVRFPERYNPKGKIPSDSWEIRTPHRGKWGKNFFKHFCPFPVRLVERILKIMTDEGDIVMDPFAGSGVVLATADAYGRKYVGFELRKDYVKEFRRGVLPEVKREVEEIEARRKKLRRNTRWLRDKIWDLRKLKYCRFVVREAVKDADENLNSIFAISRNEREVDVCLVFDEDFDEDEILSSIKQAEGKFGKFKVNARFRASLREDFAENPPIDIGERFWLYRKVGTHKYDSEISREEWMDASSKEGWKDRPEGIPPILSNLRIREEDRPIEIAPSGQLLD